MIGGRQSCTSRHLREGKATVGVGGITAKEAFEARISSKSKKQEAFATLGQSLKDTREKDTVKVTEDKEGVWAFRAMVSLSKLKEQTCSSRFPKACNKI